MEDDGLSAGRAKRGGQGIAVLIEN